VNDAAASVKHDTEEGVDVREAYVFGKVWMKIECENA